jgi:hypothetical protein
MMSKYIPINTHFYLVYFIVALKHMVPFLNFERLANSEQSNQLCFSTELPVILLSAY